MICRTTVTPLTADRGGLQGAARRAAPFVFNLSAIDANTILVLEATKHSKSAVAVGMRPVGRRRRPLGAADHRHQPARRRRDLGGSSAQSVTFRRRRPRAHEITRTLGEQALIADDQRNGDRQIDKRCNAFGNLTGIDQDRGRV